MFIIESQFVNMFKRVGKQKTVAPEPKRARSGHEKTPMGFCLLCLKEGKGKFWLKRGNKSSLSNHLKTHRDKGQRTTPNDAVREDSPLAAEALKAYKRICAASSPR